MRWSRQFIPTLREIPSDAVAESHKLMLRAGLVRQLSNGLFAYLPLGLRALRKVERIVREELEAVDCIEMRQPVVVPAEIWKESGRWNAFGDTMLRVKNRLGDDLVVSPTAEEAFVAVVRGELSSWKRLPLTLFQINTKYRDEIRPRYGVMRAREFTMMDAYSFNADEASLDTTYRAVSKAYRRIFARCGLGAIPVSADTGAMGGSASEEFMVESPIGDDTLVLCDCGYASNAEKATCAVPPNTRTPTAEKPTMIATPGVATIQELESYLDAGASAFIKTLVYAVSGLSGKPFAAACVRGDFDINETKLASVLGASEVRLANDDDVVKITGAPVGFAGPVGLSSVPVVCDESVMTLHDAYTGACEADTHLSHVEPSRDFVPSIVADIRMARAGHTCVKCGRSLREKKGNELGHVFKLGNKYAKSMGVSFLDEKGESRVPTMGCYGIGIDRTLASVIEEHRDGDGIVWPMSVAPFHVVIVPIMYEGEMSRVADSLYDELRSLGVDVLLDDRAERAGVKFKDADLIGIPLRIVVGDKNLPNVEVKRRSTGETKIIPAPEAAKLVARTVESEIFSSLKAAE